MATSKKEKSMADRSATFVSTATTEREKAIEQALNQIERRFGKGAIMRLGEVSKIHVDVIPTGSIALDLALGVGGIPRGRVTEIRMQFRVFLHPPGRILAAVEERGFKTRLNQPGLIWQVVALERTLGGAL